MCHVHICHDSLGNLYNIVIWSVDQKKNTLWSVDNINVYMKKFAQECKKFAICDLELHFPLGMINVKANYKIVNNQL